MDVSRTAMIKDLETRASNGPEGLYIDPVMLEAKRWIGLG